jgi:hypothetical protein
VREGVWRVAEILRDTRKIPNTLNGATMESNSEKSLLNKKKAFFHSKGITYFDKKTERAFFFILTLIMLCLGILVRFGAF